MSREDDEPLHTSVLVAPAAERRRSRKARRAAATAIQAKQNRQHMAEAKARAEAERAERRARAYLPTSGAPGPAALRTPGRFRLPRHQDTTASLAAAYPSWPRGVWVVKGCSSARTSTPEPRSSMTRGCSTPAA